MKAAKGHPVLPVLPLRDVVVYPNMVIPLFVGREKSMRALERAMQADKQIVLLAQKAAEIDDPGVDDLYQIGTLAQVLQLLKLPDGTVKVLVEGGDGARQCSCAFQRARRCFGWHAVKKSIETCACRGPGREVEAAVRVTERACSSST
jgi:ATP-dependent Lon protease